MRKKTRKKREQRKKHWKNETTRQNRGKIPLLPPERTENGGGRERELGKIEVKIEGSQEEGNKRTSIYSERPRRLPETSGRLAADDALRGTWGSSCDGRTRPTRKTGGGRRHEQPSWQVCILYQNKWESLLYPVSWICYVKATTCSFLVSIRRDSFRPKTKSGFRKAKDVILNAWSFFFLGNLTKNKYLPPRKCRSSFS